MKSRPCMTRKWCQTAWHNFFGMYQTFWICAVIHDMWRCSFWLHFVMRHFFSPLRLCVPFPISNFLFSQRLRPELIESLKLGNLQVFVQLIHRQTRTKNQLKKPKHCLTWDFLSALTMTEELEKDPLHVHVHDRDDDDYFPHLKSWDSWKEHSPFSSHR